MLKRIGRGLVLSLLTVGAVPAQQVAPPPTSAPSSPFAGIRFTPIQQEAISRLMDSEREAHRQSLQQLRRPPQAGRFPHPDEVETMNADSPFLPDNDAAYRRWREAKLTDYPSDASALIVDLADPSAISDVEYQALMQRLRKTNMAIYRSDTGGDPDKAKPRALAERFGLNHLDSNLLADDDGLTSITVNPEGDHPRYIPYTSRPINWHCDGYYNTGEHQIRGMLLHCVQPAAEGGENRLLDHEVAYLLLRDENPDFIRTLMTPDVMTIPPGKDGEGGERGASVGPVFSIHEPTGSLHMRYTARKRNIEWRDDAATAEALAALEHILAGEDHPYIFRARLEAGMGLLCNNVLHTRDGFSDASDGPQRLLYRARYFDRICGT